MNKDDGDFGIVSIFHMYISLTERCSGFDKSQQIIVDLVFMSCAHPVRCALINLEGSLFDEFG